MKNKKRCRLIALLMAWAFLAEKLTELPTLSTNLLMRPSFLMVTRP